MTTINRFSSRRQRLDHAFLSSKLKGAKSYKRIAGYFRSSIFELVGEEIAGIPHVRIVCNSELDAADVCVSKHVRETALKERWNDVPAEVEALLHRERYRRLHELLTGGCLEIRVVPKDRVFIHGKAGVIELADGSKTCFLGSINETKSAFAQNYEILWEDTSAEGVSWVKKSSNRSGRIHSLSRTHGPTEDTKSTRRKRGNPWHATTVRKQRSVIPAQGMRE